jgi:predicted dehydrogenase
MSIGRLLPSHPPGREIDAGKVDRVRIAIVGLNFGRHIVGDLTHGPGQKHVELAAVCDLDAARAAEIAGSSGVPAVATLDELLADQCIEAIGLFTGPVGRADLIRKIIRAGKHVMTTKPFELNPAAALEALQEARRLGRVVHLNSPAPVLPDDLQQIRQWQRQYNLGRPVACRRDVWASYREQADGGWYDDPRQCPVAPIFRLGIYLINDLVRLFGEAESVQVMQSRLFTGRPTADNAQMAILFRNGVLGTIFASFCVNDGQQYANTMTLNYERGTIYRNTGPRPDGLGQRRPQMSLVARTEANQTMLAQAEPADSSGAYQWENFKFAVRGGILADQVTAGEIVAGIKIIAAMARTEESGRTEQVI